MTIRRAAVGDAALLAEHRAAVWVESSGWSTSELAPQIPIWTAFFRDALESSSYVAYIAEEAGRIVGSGGLLVHLAIPRPGLASDRTGRVQSVYVLPAARRRGIARLIMRCIVAFARDAHLIALVLRPSENARALYAQLGFEPSGELLLRFTQGSGRTPSPDVDRSSLGDDER
jgi:GNAT superfamily N-acetyltransferase